MAYQINYIIFVDSYQEVEEKQRENQEDEQI